MFKNLKGIKRLVVFGLIVGGLTLCFFCLALAALPKRQPTPTPTPTRVIETTPTPERSSAAATPSPTSSATAIPTGTPLPVATVSPKTETSPAGITWTPRPQLPTVTQSSTGAVYRIGALCVDGTSSTAIGSGACSKHDGVKCWKMSDGTCIPK